MGKDMWPSYKLDFIYLQLKINPKEHGFLFNFISAIELKSHDKIKLEDEEMQSFLDSNFFSCAISTLHFQFHLHHKLIQSHSTTLELLNEMELKSSNLQAEITPIDLLISAKPKLLCQIKMDLTFRFFMELGKNRESFYCNVQAFNTIFEKMVSSNDFN